MKMNGPVAVEIKVFVTAKDPGEKPAQQPVGMVTMPLGVIPTKEELQAAVDEFVRDQMPEEFRLMTKQEFWDYQTVKVAGVTMPIEGAPDFED